MNLSHLGWDDFFARHFSPHAAAGLVPARVSLQHKHAYEVLLADSAMTAACTGRLVHSAATPADLPAVGDWIAVRPRPGEAQADIHAVLPRRSCFSRRSAGETNTEQVIACNIDTVLLVTALDQNFNLRRIERYLAAAWESGAQPVVVLNKCDLHPDPLGALAEVESIAPGAPVVVLSANDGTGCDALSPWLEPGRTLALLGSSGVGKSTLINRILGAERQATNAISDAVGKGRHTTTQRELIVCPSGVLIIDTPGMRELQLWGTPASAIGQTFGDIAELANHCRFRDCAHRSEPGCAIQAALENGTLTLDRWQSFQKLQREQAHAERKAHPQLAREQKQAWKRINKAHRDRTQHSIKHREL